MACNRHNWRALFIPVALLALASTAGCLRSSFLRPPVEPVLEPQTAPDPATNPNANDHAVVPPRNGANPSPEPRTTADASGASLATPLTSVPTPALSDPGPNALHVAPSSGTSVAPPPNPQIEAPSSLAIKHSGEMESAGSGQAFPAGVIPEGLTSGKDSSKAPCAPASAEPAVAAATLVNATAESAQIPAYAPSDQSPSSSTPPASSTPLLDAAIERVEAVTRQERESSRIADVLDDLETEAKPASKAAGSITKVPARTVEPSFPIVLARAVELRDSRAIRSRKPVCPRRCDQHRLARLDR